MQTNNKRLTGAGLVVFTLFAVVLLYNALFSFSYGHDWNYRNVSIDTTVNITNSKPEVLIVNIDDPITLNAGSTVLVQCNATVRDWNGWADIQNVTAVFWDNSSVNQSNLDDNNDHYTNVNCTDPGNDGNFTAYFSCNFTVWYYANPGSNWMCNVTATDSYVFNATVGSSNWLYNTTTVSVLLALNVSPTLVDYGNMAVGDTSVSAEQANITNFGNSDINISVKGYGQTEGDGLAFVCAVGNISIANERYSLNATDAYANYLPLNSTFEMVPGLVLPQQTNDSTQVLNNTYWKLYVPPNPFGVCNGTIVFQAEAAS